MEHLQNFHYKVSGNFSSKNYLVFLHGLMGSGVNWNRIAKSFEAEAQVLTFDQRGHGRSFKPKSGYDPNDYADDLKKIIDELGWDKINLVGHSMGGRNAITFADKYPNHVDQLVIEDISPSIKLNSIDSMRVLINSVPVPFVSKKIASNFFESDFLNQFTDKKRGQAVAQFFNMNIIETSSGSADWRFFKKGILESLEMGRRQDAWPLVSDLKPQTLFVYGDKSGELSDEDLRKLSELPQIKTQCIKDSGHWVHFEQAEEFIKVLKEFFAY